MDSNKKYGADLIERYLYAVAKRLPKEQRADIEKELAGLIDDMLAEKAAGGEPSPEDVRAVLLELGKPADLAAKYRGSKNCLIGPDYYGFYITVLKIVLAAVAGGLAIALTIGAIAGGRGNLLEYFGNAVSNLVSALFQAFAWVTVVFALMQRYNAKIDEKGKQWNPSDLPEVPAKKARIPKSEPVAGIVFTALAIVLFNGAPEIFGIHWFGETHAFVPIFDMDVFRSMLPFINAVFVLGIVKELFKLAIEKYNLKLAAAVTAINIVSLALTLHVFASPAIWNADFITQLQAVQSFAMPADFDLVYHWGRVPHYVAVVAVFGCVVDTMTTIAKGIRYGRGR